MNNERRKLVAAIGSELPSIMDELERLTAPLAGLIALEPEAYDNLSGPLQDSERALTALEYALGELETAYWSAESASTYLGGVAE